MSVEEVTVTKEQFNSFKDIQEQGVCNMLSPEVRTLVGITKEQHYYILNNYSELEEKYKD